MAGIRFFRTFPHPMAGATQLSSRVTAAPRPASALKYQF
jgi:hypothetical protein